MSLIDMEGEVWKPIPDFPDRYAISNKGRIKSLEHETLYKNGVVCKYKSRILNMWIKRSIPTQKNGNWSNKHNGSTRLVAGVKNGIIRFFHQRANRAGKAEM
jgi:hypothetical protein